MSNQPLKCSQIVRDLPLERFKLPTDGRKWRQAARARHSFLMKLASFANPDGTFIRNGRNYSPSLQRLLKHVAHGSYYLLTDALKAVGLLSWTRENHHDRRIYTIHLPEQVQDSHEEPLETGPRLEDEDPEQVQHSPEQVQPLDGTGPTSGTHPSLPSLPSKKRTEKPSPVYLKAKPAGKEHPQVKVIVKAIDRRFPTANINTFDRKALSDALYSASPMSDDKVSGSACAYISTLQDFEYAKAGGLLAGKFIERIENSDEIAVERQRDDDAVEKIKTAERARIDKEIAESAKQRETPAAFSELFQ